MRMNGPVMSRLSTVRRELLRGDSWFTALIFIVIAVFLFSLIASMWNNIQFQREVNEEAGVRHVRTLGEVLAKTAETLMTADELSMLRRVLVETGSEYNLKSCRIVLPDGGVLADADPAGITVLQLPPSWADEVSRATEEVTKTDVKLSFPLAVPRRGSATLEVAGDIDSPQEPGLAPQTAQMAIACLSLASMLLVHRHARFRLKAIGAIHEILLAVTDGHADLSTLELDPTLGMEAVAWNKLLGDKQSVEICNAIQQVKESVHEKSEAAGELLAAFNAAPYGLLVVGDRMRVEQVNGAAAVLLEMDREQLVHSDINAVIGDQQVLDGIRSTMASPDCKRAVIIAQKSGSLATAVLRFTICPVRHEGSRVALVTIEDITQQRVAEDAMNSFLAKAAHELRTPLTNVRLLVEDALERCEQDPASTGKSLNVINEETQRLERSVSEILSVSQIEAGSFELKADDVRMDVLLGQLKADHDPQAREKKISLDLEMPPKLPVFRGDRDKISLVLHNLLGNALKYTPDGGHVVVSAALEKGRLSVAVTDTGFGIGPDELERVFEKFYRSKNPAAAHVKGSGLGLAIARDIARLHGGDVTLESELGKGSTFTVTLPIIEEHV